MEITPENLIENLQAGNIGPWSQYDLAEEAIVHYFPAAGVPYDPECPEDGRYLDPGEVAQLCDSLGCNTWRDLIIKYHTEVGYECHNEDGAFNTDALNEY